MSCKPDFCYFSVRASLWPRLVHLLMPICGTEITGTESFKQADLQLLRDPLEMSAACLVGDWSYVQSTALSSVCWATN